MTVNIRLFATFRIDRFAEKKIDYAPGTSVSSVIEELGIPESQIGMIMLNSRHVEPHHPLREGDSLAIFPLVGGG